MPEADWVDALAPFLIAETQQAYFDLALELALDYYSYYESELCL